MDSGTLARLLREHEGPALEFKRTYPLWFLPGGALEQLRDEVAKDLIALANTNTLRSPAYLILGADDALRADGSREHHDVTPQQYHLVDFRAIVNDRCEPAIEGLNYQEVTVDGCTYGVIEIAPSPQLHVLSRDLSSKGDKDKGKLWRKGSVVYRHGDDVCLASPDVIDSLRAAKGVVHSWAPDLGHVLTREDFYPEDVVFTADILTGEIPTPYHVRRGYFRERPEIWTALLGAFTSWLETCERSAGKGAKIPVFWIGGRSGDGKSVLLLQLLAHCVRTSMRPVFYLGDRMRLPDAVNHAQRQNPLAPLLLVASDDLYDLPDRATWEYRLTQACQLGAPRIAIVTAGPTDQMELFLARLRPVIRVAEFRVPALDQVEARAFVDWFAARRGTPTRWSPNDNVLLVLLMFQLGHGEGFTDFALRFRRRLENAGIFEAMRTTVALNALYLDAPEELLRTDDQRAALERMCDEDQLHFRQGDDATGGRVRIAHAHIAWQLFLAWRDPPFTDKALVTYWSRALVEALATITARQDATAVYALLVAVASTDRLDVNQRTAILIAIHRRDELRRSRGARRRASSALSPGSPRIRGTATASSS
jgi:hypothetical protein